MKNKDQDTLDYASTGGGEQSGTMIGLTLLFHPDVARVGQIAMLFSAQLGGERRVSRLEPDFGLPGDVGSPLESPILSRKALTVRMTAQGEVVIDPGVLGASLLINGRALAAPIVVVPTDLERGVVIELAECVVLLLHWVAVSPSPNDLGLLGDSLAIRKVRTEIERVADLDVGVLIRGDTGSGKELVARAIHERSKRSAKPFIAVNMAAVPSSLAASSLFGHTQGAFSGATANSSGYFGAAEGGTLFLDEIGETPRELQAALLRAIREGEVQRVGESRPKTVDVRVLTATDADLETMVGRGDFSAPLLRRIEGYSISVPPLRDRRDDIARLFFHFLPRELQRVGEPAKLRSPAPTTKPWLPTHIVRALVEYAWPGNVAELQTVAMRVAVSNRGRPRFELDDWLQTRLYGAAGPPLSNAVVASSVTPAANSVVVPAPATKKDARSLSDEEIVGAMRANAFKIKAAAAELGVSLGWLHTRIDFCKGIRKGRDLTVDEITAAGEETAWAQKRMAERLEVSLHSLRLRMNALKLR